MPVPSPYQRHITSSAMPAMPAMPANSPGGEGQSGTHTAGSRSAGYLAAGDYWFSDTTGIAHEAAARRTHT
ncbi:hypothetical protein [Streptomyces sp. NBC_01276]|uniref:hypothetical protein n=1 Tax=Streptomyces sp. NBC_01276 TaxID=2903808 RepID=UPI00352D65D3